MKPYKEMTKQEKVDAICEMVSEGMTIREVATELGVSPGMVIKIVSETEMSSKQYARSRDAASDLFESDIIEAAMSVTTETAPADRVKIDALKWIAARRSPRKYSERIQQEHTSPDGSLAPTRIEIVAPSVKD